MPIRLLSRLLGTGFLCIACSGKSFTPSSDSGGTGGTTAMGGSQFGGEGTLGGSSGNSSETGGETAAGGNADAGGSGSTLATGGDSATGGSLATGGTGTSLQTISFGERPNATFTGVTNDTDLLSSSPTFNYGFSADFGCNASPLRIGLVRFGTWGFGDVYGHGRTVIAARLHLWTMPCSGCQASAGTVIQIFGVNQYWQEVANDSTPGAGGIPNWTQADVDTSAASPVTVDWTAPGAQPPARGTTELAHFSPTSTDTDYVISLPASVAQAWLDNPEGNYGVELMISGSTTDSVTFQSCDGDTTKAPLFEVDLAE